MNRRKWTDEERLRPDFLGRIGDPPRKVALLRPCRIGDYVCATPAIRALRATLPDAEITYVGLSCTEEMVDRSPHLDRFIRFPGYPGVADHFFDSSEALAFFTRMHLEHFDLVVQIYGSGVHSNPVAMMMGGKFTAGFIRDVDPPGHLDFAHVLPESLHEVDRLLSLSAALGARRLGRHTEFHLSEEDRGQAARFLADVPRPLIGIQPGARYAIRRWSPEKFAGTSKILQAATAGTVVILGGPEEDRIGAWLAGELNGPCLNLTGTIPVPILGALIERLDVLLTNDSGPAHIAYALDRPTIVVWGGAVLAHWGPPEIKEHIRVICRDVPCRPCWRAHCPLGYHCLEEIHAEEVAAAALGVLAAGKRGDYGCTPYADIQLASFLHKTRENI